MFKGKIGKIGYFVEISTIISFLICICYSNNIRKEYYCILLFPLLFLILTGVLLPFLYDKKRCGKITVIIILCLQWIRSVLLPTLGSICGYFSAITYNTDAKSITLAVWLFIYEQIAVFTACLLILLYTPPKSNKHIRTFNICGSIPVYCLYVFFACILYLMKGRNIYSFFRLSLTGTRASQAIADTGLIIRALIDYGLTFGVIILIYYFYKKYCENNRKKYMWSALIIVLLRLSIINTYSEGRLSIVYLFGAFALLLPILFTKYKKTTIQCVSAVAITVITMMTIYKTFNAFLYETYSDALAKGTEFFDLNSIVGIIDINFYGIKTVARNIYVSRFINLSINVFLTDILRNSFGIHYFFNNSTNTTVALYNLFIYNGLSTSGHLFSSLAYGNSYFSPLFAPLSTVFNICIVAYFEKFLQKTNEIDKYYVICITYIRLVATVFCCFPMGWNFASRSLVLGFCMIYGSSIFKKQKITQKKTLDINDVRDKENISLYNDDQDNIL